jgi:hypothetical protein
VRRFAGETGSAELGDPIGGASAYDTCVYDQAGTLVGALRVDRAGATCGSRPCWKPIKSIGALAFDADRVLQRPDDEPPEEPVDRRMKTKSAAAARNHRPAAQR